MSHMNESPRTHPVRERRGGSQFYVTHIGHVTHIRHTHEACHIYEWVMSHACCQRTHLIPEQRCGPPYSGWYKSSDTHGWVMSHIWGMPHIWRSHVTQMMSPHELTWFVSRKMSGRVILHVWIMSHIWMSHATHMNESTRTHQVRERECGTPCSVADMSHVTPKNESCHTYGACHTYEGVTSHNMNESPRTHLLRERRGGFSFDIWGGYAW